MTSPVQSSVLKKKLLSRIAAVQKQAESSRKAAKLAKAAFKQAKQKSKDAKRAAKKIRKELKSLRGDLAALVVKEKNLRKASAKTALKRPRPIPGSTSGETPNRAEEPVATTAPVESLPPAQ